MKITEINARKLEDDLKLVRALEDYHSEGIDGTGYCGYIIVDGEGQRWKLRFEYGASKGVTKSTIVKCGGKPKEMPIETYSEFFETVKEEID